MDKIFYFLLLTFSFNALAVTTSSKSEDETDINKDWFQIEIVILRHLNNEQYLVDLPKQGAAEFGVDEYQSLVQGSEITTSQLPQVTDDKLAIKEKFDTLRRSRNYRPLLLTGWKMHLPPEKLQLPVRIVAGEMHGNKPEIEGFITIKRSRYLHLNADLALTQYVEKNDTASDNLLDAILNPQQSMTSMIYSTQQNYNTEQHYSDSTQTGNLQEKDSQTAFAQEGVSFVAKDHQRLIESRRIRSGELHYLDHPAFGLLVRIITTDAPVEEIPEQETITDSTTIPTPIIKPMPKFMPKPINDDNPTNSQPPTTKR